MLKKKTLRNFYCVLFKENNIMTFPLYFSAVPHNTHGFIFIWVIIAIWMTIANFTYCYTSIPIHTWPIHFIFTPTKLVMFIRSISTTSSIAIAIGWIFYGPFLSIFEFFKEKKWIRFDQGYCVMIVLSLYGKGMIMIPC